MSWCISRGTQIYLTQLYLDVYLLRLNPFRTAGNNSTWLHLIVSIHAVVALSLCVFVVLGYVAGSLAMTLVVLFIFQIFVAILGLTAIACNRQGFQIFQNSISR